MRFSVRLLVIDQSDNIYRLEVARFRRMLATPRSHRFPQFAGQRVRSAEVVVELQQRRPTRVVRMTHSVLTFDQAGYLDAETLNRQRRGRFDAWASILMGREADWDRHRVAGSRASRSRLPCASLFLLVKSDLNRLNIIFSVFGS
jgi:hypothetical protein